LEHDGVVPDIMAVAKGLGGGYLALGAAILQERLWEPLAQRHGGLMTGHTFSGHTTACAAGVAVQRIVERDQLLDKVKEDGIYLASLFLGIELVADRATKEPYDPAFLLHARVRDQSFADGLICYPAAGNVDGVKGDHIILAPPYNATRAELEEIVDKLQRSLTQAIGALPRR
jgi:adenosylmethionine-8-amino-7-oxononanoate aminotransferase